MSKDKCRNHLQATGQPYPKSGCEVCGGVFNVCKYLDSAKPEQKEKKGFEHFIDRFIADGHEALNENPSEEAQSYIKASLFELGLLRKCYYEEKQLNIREALAVAHKDSEIYGDFAEHVEGQEHLDADMLRHMLHELEGSTVEPHPLLVDRDAVL